jgi:subtilisin family serine protease
MRRYSKVLLTLLVILGLTLSAVPAPSPSSASQAAARGPAADTVPDLAGPRAKHKKHKERKKDRKQKDRKRDRKHKGRKHHGQQGAELPTGILPGADTVDPIGPDGKLNAKDRYIVRLKPDTGNASRTSKAVSRDIGGITPTHVYSHVFDGFAAVIPADKLDDVRNDPRVASVAPDGVVYAFEQTLPTGIRRIDADENPTADIDGNDERVDIDVAVIDTAGKGTHEDQNIHAWGNCTASHNNSDDQGHGTHVGGTIGAVDNGVGVAGVAPGARLWNLRVLVALPSGGASGLYSWIICGLDLATQYATPQGDGLGDIEVANMSLGGPGPDDSCAGHPLHQAICQTVDAGVTVVVAAGNSDSNASFFIPATYEEVITVSALADSNGEPAPPGSATSAGPDESLATFSNWGPDVDLAAPGVDIRSTVPSGSCEVCDPSGYDTISGTSMASPHVAGAAALYLATHDGATPAQVKAALLAARTFVNPFPNDPDGANEGVLNVGAAFGASSASRDRQHKQSAESKHAKAEKDGKGEKKAKHAKKSKQGKGKH